MEYTQNRKCIAELGCFAEIGSVVKEYGSRPLIVSYHSLSAVIEKAKESITAAGAEVSVYTGILPEPNIDCMEAGYQAAVDGNCDVIIGIGGGSVLDSAKIIAMLVTNRAGSLEDYQMGRIPITKPPLPIIAVPTTAGTGSEATKTCVISNEHLGVKKSINHYSLVPNLAMLDGRMLTSLPKRVLASTGMDALGHAIESYTSLAATAYSRTFSARSIELLSRNLEKAYTDGHEEALQNVMLGSFYGGCAINCVGIGIAHIVGQPLGALLHKGHGDLINVLLPHAMEFNLTYVEEAYCQIGRMIDPGLHQKPQAESAHAAIAFIKELQKKLGLPSCLRELDVTLPPKEDVLQNIAVTTGHIKSNPRPLDEELIWNYIETAMG